MAKHHSTSEIERLLRGDLSDIEDLVEDDEDGEMELDVPEEILEARLNDFEMLLANEDVLEDEQVLAVLPGEPNNDGNEPDTLIDDIDVDVLLEDDEIQNIPLFNRLTKIEQQAWIKSRDIKRWRNLTNNDDFQNTPNIVAYPPPPEDVLEPKEYFDMFFDRPIMENLVVQTNLYSVQKTGNSIGTTFEEMEQFFGLHILAGIVKVPSYRMYWSDDTRYSLIADVISRNRFDTLRNNLHINDNTYLPDPSDREHDKLFKVRPLIDAVRNNFKKIAIEEKLCVDEMMIPFKGRSSMKQYMRNKPHKWGLKVFSIASKSGIVHDFEIYVGKGTVPNGKLGISGDIVLRLAEIIPHNNQHKLYFDNWFTSHALLCELKNLGIMATGTVKENRMGHCPFESNKDLFRRERGSYDIKVDSDRNIVACKWLDNKIVCLASTHVGLEPLENVERWSNSTKKKIVVPRPAIVKEYNSAMGGVDLHDMLVELYRIDFRVKRYYLRIFYHLIDMSIVNAWLLYRRHWTQLQKEKKPMPLIKFKLQIAQSLINSGENKCKKRGRPSIGVAPPQQVNKKKYKYLPRPVDYVRYDNTDHWPCPTDDRKRCKQCIKNYATIKCSKCEAFLCLNQKRNCFIAFHRKPT